MNDTEEAELVNFEVQCSKVGNARSRKDVLAVVQQALRAKGKDVLVTGDWWESLKHRHPEITLRSAEPLAYAIQDQSAVCVPSAERGYNVCKIKPKRHFTVV